MFYRPEDGHGLKHNPFKAIVTPRPIGWISTRTAAGDNLAPYSFFNGVADNPPQVLFASTGTKVDRDGTKDSVAQIRESGVFCVNVVSYALRDVMNRTSGPWGKDVDEFTDAGIEKAECEVIDCPRVAASPANLECRLTQTVDLKGPSNILVIGEVVGVHLRDDVVTEDGIFDVLRYEPLSRLGYRDYAKVDNIFSLARPGD